MMNDEEGATRSLLDQLLTKAGLYRHGGEYEALLDFAIRLRNFAPFNAMLLQIQRPGLRFAASEYDWKDIFDRTIKWGARPLLILWPFGPVALVYDVVDTIGEDLPRDVESFWARGPIDERCVADLKERMGRRSIACLDIDAGDGSAGAIRRVVRRDEKPPAVYYEMQVNRNHSAPKQFATIAHELAHLFLGHLGSDSSLRIPTRDWLGRAEEEIEAESVSYLICKRNGVESASDAYLSPYLQPDHRVDHLDVYQIMRAAGNVEALLGLTVPMHFGKERGRQGLLPLT